MILLVTYDVNTEDIEGKRRLRHVARTCLNYGIRVQMSVFECNVSPAQKIILENELLKIIDLSKDSLRIYNLGTNYSKISHYGSKKPIDIDNTIIF